MRLNLSRIKMSASVLAITCIGLFNPHLLTASALRHGDNAVTRPASSAQSPIQALKTKLRDVERMRFKTPRGYRVKTHLSRLVRLLEISELPDSTSQREALALMGLKVDRRTVGDKVEVIVVKDGEMRVVKVRPKFDIRALLLRAQQGTEQPDGATAPVLFDPTTVEECEDYADVQIAIAEQGEAEWQATYNEIENWINENPEAECDHAIAAEMPGDSAASSGDLGEVSVCSDKAWTALANAAGAVLGYIGMKGVTSAALTSLQSAAGAAIAAYEAGAATWAATTLAVGGAITAFLGSISAGWIATAALAVAGGYYAYEYLDCLANPIEPTEILMP